MGVFLSSASAESIIDEVKPFMARMPQFAYQVRLWPKEDLLGQWPRTIYPLSFFSNTFWAFARKSSAADPSAWTFETPETSAIYQPVPVVIVVDT
jgi:hypothetical protein